MELGQRLKQARLEAGLSQRQLCADIITRNMLSQIENGTARPSMDTLRYLAGALGKPMSYFLEETAVLSSNQQLMEQLRLAKGEQALVLLEEYQAPDRTFDWERYLIEVLACLEAAAAAIADDRLGYAAALLQQAKTAGEQTPYYTPWLERERVLLCWQARALPPETAAALLPKNTHELMLRAEAALAAGDADRCGRLLEAIEGRNENWYFLRGESFLAQGDAAQAANCYHRAEDLLPARVYPRLEQCYRELEDFKKAYEYACKQR